jgi:proteasome lid subunit RPN8/RPN11
VKNSVSLPLRLAPAVWETIRAGAERGAPDEVCGLLLGDDRRIALAWPARNVADTPQVRYEIEPRDHFAAIRHARASRLAVVGAWHSHPRSTPIPSPTDRAEALEGFLYLIVGRSDESPWTPRVFVLVEGNFVERTLVIQA